MTTNKPHKRKAMASAGLKIGRNACCPCGSGKKYKRCCGLPAAQNQSSSPRVQPDAARELEQYVASVTRWAEAQYSASSTEENLDRRYLNLRPETYLATLEGLSELTLLPAELPDAFRRCISDDGGSPPLAPLLSEIAACQGFDQYQQVALSMSCSELQKAARYDDYSFSMPQVESLPVLCHRAPVQPYAPQYVGEVPVFPQELGDMLDLPVIFYSTPRLEDFYETVSFIHEVVHVMQRAFRKLPVPCYVVRASGRVFRRNVTDLVRLGIEDEIEVQKILVRAGYPFKLRPIVYHRNSVEGALADLPPDEASAVLRLAVEGIPFDRYAGLFDGDLEAEVVAAFCSGWQHR